MTIVKKLTKILGGQIKLKSTGGKGSTFSFHLLFEISTQYQMVKDETFAQTQPRLNLATFVTTYMDEYATKLMNEAININYIDETEYPRIAVMNGKCINIVANLWNSPEKDTARVVSTAWPCTRRCATRAPSGASCSPTKSRGERCRDRPISAPRRRGRDGTPRHPRRRARARARQPRRVPPPGV